MHCRRSSFTWCRPSPDRRPCLLFRNGLRSWYTHCVRMCAHAGCASVAHAGVCQGHPSLALADVKYGTCMNLGVSPCFPSRPRVARMYRTGRDLGGSPRATCASFSDTRMCRAPLSRSFIPVGSRQRPSSVPHHASHCLPLHHHATPSNERRPCPRRRAPRGYDRGHAWPPSSPHRRRGSIQC